MWSTHQDPVFSLKRNALQLITTAQLQAGNQKI